MLFFTFEFLNLINMTDFDDIRPYNDEEVPEAIASLISDPMFVSVVEQLYPQPGEYEKILQFLSSIDNVVDLQAKIIYPLLVKIEKISTNGITYSTMDQFHPDEKYLFISNHRDIILDPAFLNLIMQNNGFRKTENAIGDNLLIYDWIKLLVRINRSFIVKRNLGLRDQLEASKTLSSYIRNTLTSKGESVWLAQREGRTKDGNDQTQPALLKMLNMSNEGSRLEGFFELNIVPMAISYEIEPCGISKVEELLKRKYIPDFAKTQHDDLRSMANGFMNPKGRVHFAFGNPLNYKLVELIKGRNMNDFIQAISEYIDKGIYFNFKLWPTNYSAYDLLNQTQKYSARYNSLEKEQFISRMENEISSIYFDKSEATELYLRMYANPVINFEKYFE
jgi:hypothetical protein